MPTELTATDFLKRAARVAEHFGFLSIAECHKHPDCKNCVGTLRHTASMQDRRLDALHGMLTAGISTYTTGKLHGIQSPILCYSIEHVPRTGEAALSMQVFNVEKSIAESLLIQASRAIARELGFGEQVVRVNSVGDSDSVARYTRELTNFMRKRAADLPPAARELMKDHVIDALLHLIEKDHELSYRSPSPLEYLSDASRRHFREIVEYLEMSETPYEIDPKLIGHLNCYSDGIFAIDAHNPSADNPPAQSTQHGTASLFIRGGRYNTFMRRHTKQEIPAAGAVVILRGKKAPRRTPAAQTQRPSVYLVQLGFGPKIRSLMLLDLLRQAGVPTYQNLASDSLSTQLRDAEERGVKYVVIIGQKEYVDNAAILRNLHARSQEQVPFTDLVARLKRSVSATSQ
ncbi:MAG: His/Gly/Thr/Pro-type tRNA ligase C-terminal domain-containing protein [Candidatus Paceibacterota bacterium]